MADTPRAPVPHVAGIYRLPTRPRRRRSVGAAPHPSRKVDPTTMMTLTTTEVFKQTDESECSLTWTLEHHEEPAEHRAQLRVETDGAWVDFTHRRDVDRLITFLEGCAAALPCNDPTDDPSVASTEE